MTERMGLSDVTEFLLRLSLSLESHGASADELEAIRSALWNAELAIVQRRRHRHRLSVRAA